MSNFLIATRENNIGKEIRESAISAGFNVSEAKDGISAVQMCGETDFDIVIMDTALPELDGFSACKEIRKSKEMPIIFISSSRSESDKILGFEVGADDFMVKPISVKVLMARVNAIIRRQTGKKSLDRGSPSLLL